MFQAMGSREGTLGKAAALWLFTKASDQHVRPHILRLARKHNTQELGKGSEKRMQQRMRTQLNICGGRRTRRHSTSRFNKVGMPGVQRCRKYAQAAHQVQ